jgi:uncharacterized membrane protein
VKKFSKFLFSSFVAGLLVLAPIYLVALLVLKAMKSLVVLVKPIASMLPEWVPAERLLSLFLVLLICLLIGMIVRTAMGHTLWSWFDSSVLQKIPGYALIRSMTEQLAGQSRDQTWKPALAEIEEALVPAFIIEALDDGRFTVFVPSVPTPLAGSIYILTSDRVHPLNVPFTQAIKTISRWGSGSKELLAAMEKIQ